jgi:DNA repair protein RecO (recombination protein O)
MGKTSIIDTIFTELFGVPILFGEWSKDFHQKRNGESKPVFSHLLSWTWWSIHNELKHLNRIKEFKWGYFIPAYFIGCKKECRDIIHGRIADKMFEATGKQSRSFSFCGRCFYELRREQRCSHGKSSLCSLLCTFLSNLVSGSLIILVKKILFLDLQEGQFVAEQPLHRISWKINRQLFTSRLLKCDAAGENWKTLN